MHTASLLNSAHLPASVSAHNRHSPSVRSAHSHQVFLKGSNHASKHSRQRHLARVQVAAKAEEGAEPGRLVQDALEFNKSTTSPNQLSGRAPVQQEEHQPGDLLGGKYQVVKLLAKGKSGLVYKAERPGGGLVAVKSLSLRSMADWKQLELFEKEAKAMRQLSHNGIPAYIDYFEVDSDGDRGYFLVQELVEGSSLAQMVQAGWKPSKQEVERIAAELLSTLSYLQKQQVVHRDIKPENILIQGGQPGGKVYLTDFGGAHQSAAENSDEAEDIEMGTVVGTYGYMAPEQLRGAARPASDLFALGGTLLYLLSGEEPSSFPQRRLKPDFSSVSTSPKLQTLLEGLLEPTWEDRLTVKQAHSVLAGRSSPQQSQPAQQARARPSFGDWGWSNPRDSNAQSSSKRQDEDEESQEASTSGRDAEPQGFGLNPILLALAAAYVLPGPLAPLVALSLPFWLGGRKRSRRSRQGRQPASYSQRDAARDGAQQDEEEDWMSGNQKQQQGGFGFSDSPAQDAVRDVSDGAELTEDEREAMRKQRRQQQMAAFQQQQMVFNMLRMMGGGMGGGMMGRGGFRRPYGMRGGFGGPFGF